MTRLRWGAYALVAGLVVLGAGYLWGAAGRWSVADRMRTAELQCRMAEGRAALAGARVDLFELNYGQASRRLDAARQALDEGARRMDEAGRTAEAAAVREAIALAAEAQRLSASVDAAANARAADALRALDRASQPAPR